MKRTLAAAAALMLTPALAVALTDLTGDWDMTSQVQLDGEEVACEYTGMGELTQTGSQVTGTVTMDTLLSGPRACEVPLEGQLNASVKGDTISGTLDTLDLGMGDFTGEIKSDDLIEGAMSFSDDVGGTTPLAPTGSSTWTAARAPSGPAMGPLALALLALLVVGGAGLNLARRSRA